MYRVQNNWIGLLDTAAQYYLHKDVSGLSDQEWSDEIARLDHIRGLEKEQSKIDIDA